MFLCQGRGPDEEVHVPCPAAHTVLLVEGVKVFCDPEKLVRRCEEHKEQCRDKAKGYYCRWVGRHAIVTVYEEA